MNHEQRLYGLIFHGLQQFNGAYPDYGVFTDPLTKSSFSVPLNEPIGPCLDRLIEHWEKCNALGDTLDDEEATEDLLNDMALQDKLDER